MLDLQTHMHSYIGPSILVHVEGMDPKKRAHWLATQYADQRWIEGKHARSEWGRLYKEAIHLCQDAVINALTEGAIKFSAETGNGVYLHPRTSVKWCTEDQMLVYHS